MRIQLPSAADLGSVRTYLCVWGVGYTQDAAIMQIENSAYFSDERGYDDESIEKVACLDYVGDSCNLSDMGGRHHVTLIRLHPEECLPLPECNMPVEDITGLARYHFGKDFAARLTTDLNFGGDGSALLAWFCDGGETDRDTLAVDASMNPLTIDRLVTLRHSMRKA